MNVIKDIQSLIQLIHSREEVIVFPIGAEGQQLLDFLRYTNFLQRVCCIAAPQVDGNNTRQDFIHEVPIIPFEHLVHFRETALFIVVAPNQYHQNFYEDFTNFGFKNIALISDELQTQIKAALQNMARTGQIMMWYFQHFEKKITSIEHLIEEQNEISEIKTFLKPAEYRRMGKLLKSSLLTSLKALKQSGITTPDAIITATSLGCWENSEKILDNLSEPKPTLFMQSTHNTIGSNIAIYLKCHGYNITYTQGSESLDKALRDAKMLLESGKCKNVLVGLHEETTEKYRALMQKNGVTDLKSIYSLSLVLTKKL